jgi:hypothetical protein
MQESKDNEGEKRRKGGRIDNMQNRILKKGITNSHTLLL